MVFGLNGLAIRAPDAKLPPNCTELRRGAFGTSPGVKKNVFFVIKIPIGIMVPITWEGTCIATALVCVSVLYMAMPLGIVARPASEYREIIGVSGI